MVAWPVSTTCYADGMKDAYQGGLSRPHDPSGRDVAVHNKDARKETQWAAEADERDRIDFVYYRPDAKFAPKKARIMGPSSMISKSAVVEDRFIDKAEELIEPVGGVCPATTGDSSSPSKCNSANKILKTTDTMIKATIRSSCSPYSPARTPTTIPTPARSRVRRQARWLRYGNESLVAVDPAGKEIAFDYRAPRDKKSGIFYFIWLGAHGYDTGDYFGGDIIPPKATDTGRLTTSANWKKKKKKKATAIRPTFLFGPGGAMHHWGKPHLDYYVSNDTWVIRRHAQMLSEAGVDVIFIDVTNGYAYLPVVRTLCDVYNQMLREGNPRPKISFILNTNPAPVVQELLTLYGNSDYDRLWYELDGKPLLLAPPGDYGAGVSERLTFRYAWFDTQFGYGGPGTATVRTAGHGASSRRNAT